MNIIKWKKETININDINDLLTINIKDGEKKIINIFGEVKQSDKIIKAVLKNNGDLKINFGVNVLDSFNLTIDILINGNNNNVVLKGGFLANDNTTLKINSVAEVNDHTTNNTFDELFNTLVLGNPNVYIEPNMLISSNEVIASHGVTISGIDKDYLFYLCGHGMTVDKANFIIKKSVLNKYLDIPGGETCFERIF